MLHPTLPFPSFLPQISNPCPPPTTQILLLLLIFHPPLSRTLRRPNAHLFSPSHVLRRSNSDMKATSSRRCFSIGSKWINVVSSSAESDDCGTMLDDTIARRRHRQMLGRAGQGMLEYRHGFGSMQQQPRSELHNTN